MDFTARLKAAKDAVASGGGDYENLPLGTYTVTLTQAFVNVSKGGRNQTNFDWVVAEGELMGKTHRSYHNLDHDIGLKIFVQDVTTLGFTADFDSLEEADALVRNISSRKPICSITLTKKKDFINTKINELLGFSEDAPEASSSKPAPAPTAPQKEAVIEVGAKLKYKANGAIVSGDVKSIDYEKETLNFAFHKNIPLADIIGMA